MCLLVETCGIVGLSVVGELVIRCVGTLKDMMDFIFMVRIVRVNCLLVKIIGGVISQAVLLVLLMVGLLVVLV